MNVYDIKARFMKRVQVKEYEPVEAEVTMSAQLGEGEDAETSAAALMEQARAAVMDSIKSKSAGKTEATVATVAKAAPVEAVAAPAKKAAAKPAPADDDFEAPAPAKKATKPAPAPADDDFETPAPAKKAAKPAPEPEPEAEEDDEFAVKGISQPDFQSWMTGMVNGGKITPKEIKSVYPKFGITRSTDATLEQLPALKAAIEKFIAAKG